MSTLLQTLLIETLAEDTDPILRSFIETILPSIEREFGHLTALGGSEEAHFENLRKTMDEKKARQTAQKFSRKADQSLLVHVLNALLIAWNLQKYLPNYLKLSDIEKYLLCLGMVLHDYDKAERGQKEDVKEPPKANEIPRILEVCQQWGDRLNFAEFLPDWRNYLLEIAYLAQNTQFNQGSNPIAANWEIGDLEFQIDFDRLNSPLCSLLAFGDVAVHMTDPLDLITVREGNKTRTTGDALREHLELLGIEKKLVYHRLRDCRGLITNQIHNAVVSFVSKYGWEPILFFAQGAIYLSDFQNINFDLLSLRQSIWQIIIYGDKDKDIDGLHDYMRRGEAGVKRDGKAVKTAPLIEELSTPADRIRQMPELIIAKVKNSATSQRLRPVAKDPVEQEGKCAKVLKSLKEFAPNDNERLFINEFIKINADIRSDWVAEFILLAQSQFFKKNFEFQTWIIQELGLTGKVTLGQASIQSGGVYNGWYYIAARYVDSNSTLDQEEVKEELQKLADRLANWAEKHNLLPKEIFGEITPTHQDFNMYLERYLDISVIQGCESKFKSELDAYINTKSNNQVICSLSSGEFEAEDQFDTVVLFEQQQYSNKNTLGGGQLKRGISRIWTLEMLLRQAFWAIKSGTDYKTVFLYIYPAYVYSPQIANAVRKLAKEVQDIQWKKVCMLTRKEISIDIFRENDWLEREAEEGRFPNTDYSIRDIPFLSVLPIAVPKKPKEITLTESWTNPIFLSLMLSITLGVKVVATKSPYPLYRSDKEFLETLKVDGADSFWNLLGLPETLRIQDLDRAFKRLMTIYSVHLYNRSDLKNINPSHDDLNWRALKNTVREVMTNVLNIFGIANEGLRKNKRDRPTEEEVFRYWDYAQIWSNGDKNAEEKMKFIEQLVKYYRTFYQVSLSESTHTMLMPLSKAMEIVLSSPINTDAEDLVLQGSGQLHDALDRQEVFKRPFLMNKEVDYLLRKANEMLAIQQFMTFFINEVFGKQFKGDRALLQENRNRIKSGAEFAYRMQALQERQTEQSE
jgi:CRISPR-associated protein Csc3